MAGRDGYFAGEPDPNKAASFAMKFKLKPGTYKLTVQGLDSQNRTVTATATVKVKK